MLVFQKKQKPKRGSQNTTVPSGYEVENHAVRAGTCVLSSVWPNCVKAPRGSMSGSTELSAFAAVFEKQTLNSGVLGARVLTGYETKGPKKDLLSLSGGKPELRDFGSLVQTVIRETNEETKLELFEDDFKFEPVVLKVQHKDQKFQMYIFPCIKNTSFNKKATDSELQLERVAFRPISEILDQPHAFCCNALADCWKRLLE